MGYIVKCMCVCCFLSKLQQPIATHSLYRRQFHSSVLVCESHEDPSLVLDLFCFTLRTTDWEECPAMHQHFIPMTRTQISPAAGLTSGGGTQTGSTTFVLMDKILLWYLWIMKIHDNIAGNLCELKYSRFYKHTPPKTCNFLIWLRIFT